MPDLHKNRPGVTGLSLQAVVFCLVAAAFSTIYILQPVLPVLQGEFGVSETRASFTISFVILGIALSTLPFGKLVDRYPIKPIILTGGLAITVCCLFCSITRSLPLLVAARFIQGLFIPSLTTCLAAYLARSLPQERLNVVMGSYVSATVAGGLGGRLLGGWIHQALHWRYAFGIASCLLLFATITAVYLLPREDYSGEIETEATGFIALLSRSDLMRIYIAVFGAFFVFSSIFNYLPFYLSGSSFDASTTIITMMYLAYISGIIVGPLAGNLCNRIGNGKTMLLGVLVFGISIGITLIQSLAMVMVSLLGVCAGFFTIHAAAAGSLNRKLTASRGRANSLYVLFYYLGGSIGITISGYAYMVARWYGTAALGVLILAIPLWAGITEMRKESLLRL